jgi:hypothetical protein
MIDAVLFCALPAEALGGRSPAKEFMVGGVALAAPPDPAGRRLFPCWDLGKDFLRLARKRGLPQNRRFCSWIAGEPGFPRGALSLYVYFSGNRAAKTPT